MTCSDRVRHSMSLNISQDPTRWIWARLTMTSSEAFTRFPVENSFSILPPRYFKSFIRDIIVSLERVELDSRCSLVRTFHTFQFEDTLHANVLMYPGATSFVQFLAIFITHTHTCIIYFIIK